MRALVRAQLHASASDHVSACVSGSVPPNTSAPVRLYAGRTRTRVRDCAIAQLRVCTCVRACILASISASGSSSATTPCCR
eukprot:3674147-Pleurochrysis_carterae.AAC.3